MNPTDIFISANNIEPYEKISDSNLFTDTIFVNAEEGNSIVEVTQLFYLIITKKDSQLSARLLIDGENVNDITFSVSEVDTIGVPLEWSNFITFTDIVVEDTNIALPFAYRWTVLNNIYSLTAQKFSMDLDIYIEEA